MAAANGGGEWGNGGEVAIRARQEAVGSGGDVCNGGGSGGDVECHGSSGHERRFGGGNGGGGVPGGCTMLR